VESGFVAVKKGDELVDDIVGANKVALRVCGPLAIVPIWDGINYII
jgi:hypothetical protein